MNLIQPDDITKEKVFPGGQIGHGPNIFMKYFSRVIWNEDNSRTSGPFELKFVSVFKWA